MKSFRDLVNRWRECANTVDAPPLVREAWYRAADDLCELLNYTEQTKTDGEFDLPQFIADRAPGFRTKMK